MGRAVYDLARAGDHLDLGDVVHLGAVAEARDPQPCHRQGPGDLHAQVVGEDAGHHPLLQAGGRQVAPDHAAVDVGDLRRLVDPVDDAHRRGVQQHASLGRGLAALGVALAARRERNPALAAEADDLGYLRGRVAAGHGRGQVVHQPSEVGAVEGADLLVQQDPVAEGGFELAEGFGG